METIKPVKLNLAKRLQDRVFRHLFFKEFAQDEIALQIRRLREVRNLTQVKFAKISNMKQSAVSRIEQADYSGWTFKTLLKVAKTLDARLRIMFEPMEDVIREYERMERTVADTGDPLEKLRGTVHQMKFRSTQIGEAVQYEDVFRKYLENQSKSGIKEIGGQEPNRPSHGPFPPIETQSGHPNL